MLRPKRKPRPAPRTVRPRRLKVAVLFGGRSTEHEVSIRSARSIIEALDPKRYDVIPVAISRSGEWLSPTRSAALFPGLSRPLSTPRMPLISNSSAALIPINGRSRRQSRPVDVVFPVLHGTYGEDGTLQGLLEMAGVPYVGSGVLGSAAGMDKEVMKRLFRQAGLLTPIFFTVGRSQWRREPDCVLRRIEELLDYPMFTKPANSGSSVGIRKVHTAEELPRCLAEAFTYDRKVLVEEGVTCRELECAVLGNDSPRASVVGEIIPGSEFYDYDEKYIRNTTQLTIPADIPVRLAEEVRTLAVQAFRVCECEGLARVDFFYEQSTDRVLVNELNTMPGFTSISMYPKLWEATGVGFGDLVDELIRLALERHRDVSENVISYQTPP